MEAEEKLTKTPCHCRCRLFFLVVCMHIFPSKVWSRDNALDQPGQFLIELVNRSRECITHISRYLPPRSLAAYRLTPKGSSENLSANDSMAVLGKVVATTLFDTITWRTSDWQARYLVFGKFSLVVRSRALPSQRWWPISCVNFTLSFCSFSYDWCALQVPLIYRFVLAYQRFLKNINRPIKIRDHIILPILYCVSLVALYIEKKKRCSKDRNRRKQ